MKNILSLLLVCILLSIATKAQVAVNNDGSQPDPSAGLDIKFYDKGLLIPRVALIQTSSASPISDPATSLLIYNITDANDVTPGYYYWSGTAWIRLSVFENSSVTPDYIPKWATTTTLENSQIYDDGTSVGIGTTDPKSVLNINGGVTIGYTGAMGSSFGGSKNTLRISSEISLGGTYDDHPVGLVYATHSGWSNRRLVFALSDSWDAYNTTRPVLELINDYVLVNDLNFRGSANTDWSGTMNFQNESGGTHSRYGVNLNEQYGYFRIGGTITTDQMRLYSSGKLYIENNIGIGTLNPAKTLDVNGVTRSRTATGTDADNGQFQAYTGGTSQGQRAVYSFYPTFENNPTDNTPRRAADILSGFNGGAWGEEYLAFHVGGSDNAFAMTTERMRITANGNVGIGTTSPGTSAVLDVSSANKGFLPPRMTTVQMNAISSPAEGLLVFNTSINKPVFYNGSMWLTLDGSFFIGQHYGGGIVYYIDGTSQHGLIAAESDFGTNDWQGVVPCNVAGAYGQAVGTGYDNTSDIMSDGECDHADVAASNCWYLDLNGFDDWFLPSKDELWHLWNQRDMIGGFSNDLYWSSSECGDGDWGCGDDFNYWRAWAQEFPSGWQFYEEKQVVRHVRCIRSF